jgi:hypothetical protein
LTIPLRPLGFGANHIGVLAIPDLVVCLFSPAISQNGLAARTNARHATFTAALVHRGRGGGETLEM